MLSEYDTDVCHNLSRALEIAEGQNFDIIVCDVILSGGTGLDFVDGLNERGNQTPVIFMTGREDKALEKELRPRSVGFLKKPFSEDQINQIINKALPAKLKDID